MFYFVETVARGEYLGDFEQIVILAVLRLKDNAYGMSVRREIESRTGRETSIGAVYATLDRLESKGLTSSAEALPTAERGGRAKRMFRVTAEGERALRLSQDALAAMSKGVKLRVAGGEVGP